MRVWRVAKFVIAALGGLLVACSQTRTASVPTAPNAAPTDQPAAPSRLRSRPGPPPVAAAERVATGRQPLALPSGPDRISVAGFSDGASYALGLGAANGDLFRSIVALSPGFIPRGERRGMPRVFVSHGTGDEVLRIGSTSRRLVPQLRDAGYQVEYREFDGPHTVPFEIGAEAVRWLLAP